MKSKYPPIPNALLPIRLRGYVRVRARGRYERRAVLVVRREAFGLFFFFFFMLQRE